MALVIKDGIIMGCRDNTQLAAFLSCGWKVYEPVAVEQKTPAPAAEEKEPVKKAKKTATRK